MNLQECIQFAKENPICFLASVDGDQPHVRTIILDHADETGFYFTLTKAKQVYRQLCANPKIEICFYNLATDFGQAKQMRVTGIVEAVFDETLLEKAYAARKGLEALVGKPIKPLFAMFHLIPSQAHFWTIMDAMKEENIEVLHF